MVLSLGYRADKGCSEATGKCGKWKLPWVDTGVGGQVEYQWFHDMVSTGFMRQGLKANQKRQQRRLGEGTGTQQHGTLMEPWATQGNWATWARQLVTPAWSGAHSSLWHDGKNRFRPLLDDQTLHTSDAQIISCSKLCETMGDGTAPSRFSFWTHLIHLCGPGFVVVAFVLLCCRRCFSSYFFLCLFRRGTNLISFKTPWLHYLSISSMSLVILICQRVLIT